MIVMDGEEYLTAQEACALLRVKPATLYAYVSRGLIASYRQGIKRMRLYRRHEVEGLTRVRSQEGEALGGAMRWEELGQRAQAGYEQDAPEGEDEGEAADEQNGGHDGRAWIPYVS